MAIRTKEEIKLLFETGDKPTQLDFIDLIDTLNDNPMTTAGDIIYGGTSGAPTRLAKGTDGQVLTLASGLPSWGNASGGSLQTTYSLTETTTLGKQIYDFNHGVVLTCDGSSWRLPNGKLYTLGSLYFNVISYLGNSLYDYFLGSGSIFSGSAIGSIPVSDSAYNTSGGSDGNTCDYYRRVYVPIGTQSIQCYLGGWSTSTATNKNCIIHSDNNNTRGSVIGYLRRPDSGGDNWYPSAVSLDISAYAGSYIWITIYDQYTAGYGWFQVAGIKFI